jgi:hypothetical protein
MYELKEYLKAINQTKEPLMDTADEMWEKKYPAFVVNRCVYPFSDTILLVNEMNIYNGLDNKLQFHFLLNSTRARKRFSPWLKTSKIKNLETIKEYFGYSDQRAKEVLNVLTDEDISYMETKLDKGGK